MSELNSKNAYQILVNRSGHVLLAVQLFLTKMFDPPRTVLGLKGSYPWYANSY